MCSREGNFFNEETSPHASKTQPAFLTSPAFLPSPLSCADELGLKLEFRRSCNSRQEISRVDAKSLSIHFRLASKRIDTRSFALFFQPNFSTSSTKAQSTIKYINVELRLENVTRGSHNSLYLHQLSFWNHTVSPIRLERIDKSKGRLSSLKIIKLLHSSSTFCLRLSPSGKS